LSFYCNIIAEFRSQESGVRSQELGVRKKKEERRKEKGERRKKKVGAQGLRPGGSQE
jgi:hypothetical protein